MFKRLAAFRGGPAFPQVTIVAVALACGACSGGGQTAGLNQPPIQPGAPGIISGPAPTPSMASMAGPSQTSIDASDSETSMMPNENPGSGQMVGRSIPF
jgi:hypothetical protein